MTIYSLKNIIMMARTNSPYITDVDWCISMTELFGGVGNVSIDSSAERIVSHKIIFEFFNEIAYCDSLDIYDTNAYALSGRRYLKCPYTQGNAQG